MAPRDFSRIKQLDCLRLPSLDDLSIQDKVTIDLSRVNFIKPLGVIGILLLVESLTVLDLGEEDTCAIEIIPPANNLVLDYLLRVRFIDALQYLCEWSVPNDIQASGRKMKPVIPITRFDGYQDIENIANEMQSTPMPFTIALLSKIVDRLPNPA